MYIKKIDNKVKVFYNNKVSYSINYSEEKNQILKTIRGLNFDDVLESLKKDNLVKDLKHFNTKKYFHQFLLLVQMRNYIYVIPYVINKNKKEIYLKTLYPSRKYTKEYKNELERQK
jgi:hypothetical protein